MFETVELGRKATKAQYRAAVPELRTELLRVQNELRESAAFSVAVVIAGVEGAGKGETVNVLHEWMDPRFLMTHTYDAPTLEEAARPPMWRFWRDLPPRGSIGIFFGSWYTQPIVDRTYQRSDEAAFESSLARINSFEEHLTAAGVLLLKFWFHLAKKEQKRRLEALAADPEQSWRVTDLEWQHFERYDDFVPVCDQALRRTSTAQAPWTLVEATDRRYRELTVGEHLLQSIDTRMKKPAPTPASAAPVPPTEPVAERITILDRVDLSQRLAPKEYDKALIEQQARLNRLGRRARETGASCILAFEGWDAAGKGGAIRRVTAALDARGYRTVPVAAPSDEERAQPWLWRFWRRLPGAGEIVIFDRTWYGRVLVERVEKLTAEDDWRRAYKEINDFEDRLVDHGYGLAKFWLHIDREEQARRFAEREQTSYKAFKITEEDYRNRERWPLYEDAVNEMVERTSTGHAPWTLVPANDKYFARIRVLRTCCAALEDALRRREEAGAGAGRPAVRREKRDRRRRKKRG